MRTVLIALSLLLLAGCGRAAPQPQPAPALPLTGRVVDAADLLDARMETQLAARLAKLERETGAQLVVATTPSLNGQAIAPYSLALARSRGLGSRERNDGLLLLVAPAERQVRIEVGKGLEGLMKDEICAQIIRDRILPLFLKGRMQDGILSGTGSILGIMGHRPPGLQMI